MELTNFLICDDIRTEINGKSIFIGVYDGIAIDLEGATIETPKYLTLMFVIRFKNVDLPADDYIFGLNFFMDNKPYHSASLGIPAKWTGKSKKINVNFGIREFPFYKFGDLETEITITSKNNSRKIKVPYSCEIVPPPFK